MLKPADETVRLRLADGVVSPVRLASFVHVEQPQVERGNELRPRSDSDVGGEIESQRFAVVPNEYLQLY